jgi:hypothetical protein
MLRKHPLAPISAAYKRAVVRSCAEQLREIEGRLDQSCGARWEQQLQSCDDLGTVARLILALQRRSSLRSPESGWLDELASLKPEEVDRRAVELTLRIKHRLAELAEAVPYAVEPSSLIGAPVLRHYEGVGAFPGVVLEFESLVGFRVRYCDGEFEDVPLRELQSMLLRQGIQYGRDSACVMTTDGRAVPAMGEAVEGGPACAMADGLGAVLAPGYHEYVDSTTMGFVYERMLSRQQADGVADGEAEHWPMASTAGVLSLPPPPTQQQRRGSVKPAKPPAAAPPALALAVKAEAVVWSGADGACSRVAGVGMNGGAEGSAGQGSSADVLAPCAGVKRKAAEADAEESLPPGWTVEGVGARRVYHAPDGVTRVFSMAQVRRWQQSQLNMAAQYERVSERKRLKEAPPLNYGDLGVRVPAAAQQRLAVPAPKPAVARPQLPPAGMSVEDAVAAAAAMAGKAGKGVSRELRMLAMPDRDWNVALPCWRGPKTRDQFHPSVTAATAEPDMPPACV